MFSDLQDISSFNIEECAILLQYFKLSDAEIDGLYHHEFAPSRVSRGEEAGTSGVAVRSATTMTGTGKRSLSPCIDDHQYESLPKKTLHHEDKQSPTTLPTDEEARSDQAETTTQKPHTPEDYATNTLTGFRPTCTITTCNFKI